MIPDIQAGLSAVLARKKHTSPCHVNRISSLDDLCERRLYYRRAAWDKAEPIDDGLQGIFETGNKLEPVIESIVIDAGLASDPPWRIVGGQTPTNDKFLRDYNISGTIDGFLQAELPVDDDMNLQDDGKPLVQVSRWQTQGVIDIKTCSPNIFPQVNSYGDLGRYPWTRAYRGQLMLYAFAHNLDACYILFVSKQNLFDMKFVHFPVDYDYVERLLQKAKRTNEAVEKEEPPEGLKSPDECKRCSWFSFCAPDITTGGNLGIVDLPELEEVLDAMGKLSKANADFEKLKKTRDLLLVKGQDMAVGPWLIRWDKTASGQRRKKIERITGA